ncbi:peptidase M15 [Enterovibrio norvegicus FF-33]|uniref:M15 family metallopeptidase n=1 Tax=Enterovibrio norvegicus TaxID=188144 RepID=UPI0002F006A1|nr:M15 family metallopeptidase [Enterovibrio norvegicus]OEE68240.1 peptidase M15 [Enterovibrio norvegicus FF-33]
MSWTISSLTGQTRDHLVELDDRLLHRDIVDDFVRLQESAKAAGFELVIASSFRDFDRQKLIWNSKFSGDRPILDDNGNTLEPSTLTDDEKVQAILRWSALPGASRHHWGTDMDIYAANLLPEGVSIQLEPWEYLSGHQAPFFAWLEANLASFGFFFPYREDRGGVAFEPWHISHQVVTSGLLDSLTEEVLRDVIATSDIGGRDAILLSLKGIYSKYIANVCEA